MARRLFAVIALAAAMGLIFGGLQVASAVSKASEFARVTHLARLGQQGIILASVLEQERAQTAMQLAVHNGSGSGLPGDLVHWYGPVDSDSATGGVTGQAATKFTQLAASVSTSYPAGAQEQVANVLGDVVQAIPGIRSEAQWAEAPATVGGLPAPGTELTSIDYYSQAIGEIFQLNDTIAQGSGDATLMQDVQQLGAISRATDQASQQQAILWSALISYAHDHGAYSGAVPGLEQIYQALASSSAQQVGYLDSFQASASAAQGQQMQAAAFREPDATMAGVEDYVLENQTLNLTDVGMPGVAAAAQWSAVSGAAVSQYGQLETQLAQAIVDRSEAVQHAAERSAWETSVLTAIVLLLILLAAILVARSLVLPLRRLREGALEVASTSLPARVRALAERTEPAEALEVEPISVLSVDEIGQVARAFDQVHREAVRLAGNEAMLRSSLNAMFISLSRRSQSLIERLSRMIDGLELNEDDPDRLSNLFAMDHLITRMRRNSENLLVLAGYETARKRTEPVLLGDVVRAAASEIEQYGRVVLSVQSGIEVSGLASTDVIHLLAEIIENATLYSPRTTEVYVTGQELPTGGVLIEVTDNGVGISEGRLQELNWRLEHPPVVDVSVSRHMGLFAVSHLAARHKVAVRLRPASPRGMVAMIWLPSAVAAPATIGYGERLRRLGAGHQMTGERGGLADRPAAVPSGAQSLPVRTAGAALAEGGRPSGPGALGPGGPSPARPGPEVPNPGLLGPGMAGQGLPGSRGAGPVLSGTGMTGAGRTGPAMAASTEGRMTGPQPAQGRMTTGPQAAAGRAATGWFAPRGAAAGSRGPGRHSAGSGFAGGAPAGGQSAGGRPAGSRPGGAHAASGPAGGGQAGSARAGNGQAGNGQPTGGAARAWPSPLQDDAPEPMTAGLTGAGLPMRMPRGDRAPVPASAPLAAPADQAPLASRSPESARSRLGGFQHGSRRAESRQPPPGGAAPRSPGGTPDQTAGASDVRAGEGTDR
ncbi:MAG TPA: nitrate- and nitrite sensing domain-containing protein [Trebonia sp.]|nr:nitrate- and nitrite sensing domain-containing protein [Trebonia sp.]